MTPNHFKFFSKYSGLWAAFLVLIYFLWDIGNLNALRQGTESFYLQIGKEMYQTGNFFSPIVYGENHWSKPPLHFWLGFPFYFIFQTSALWTARAAIALLSVFGIFYIAGWVERHFKLERFITIFFFAATVGFNKYSRIYMMELPLTILSTAAVLSFFDSLYQDGKRQEYFSMILLAAAALVKGPVAIVMSALSIFIFLLWRRIKYQESAWPKFFRWIIVGTLLSSLWYFYMSWRFGWEFINYFFLRENLGKFSTKSYPLSSLFQGIVFFSLPWFPLVLGKLKWQKNFAQTQFIFIAFVVFFTLWLIPSQRSHHYAMPSLPFFLILIIATAQALDPLILQKRIRNTALLLTTFLLFILPIGLYVISFPELNSSTINYIQYVVGLSIVLYFSFWIIFHPGPLAKVVPSFFIIFAALWILILPRFYRPEIPESLAAKLRHYVIYSTMKRPYFLAEAIGKEITPISFKKIYFSIKDANSIVILPERLLERKRAQIAGSTELLAQWPVWKRRIKLNDLIFTIENKNFSALTYNLVAIKAGKKSFD
ncbi:MAG: hypothetical protein A2504_02205 [Bdellovibrionales bacterium RIFOXYD12_FULL_39_22]|nr:MAG: hypothetical protein A2385_12230 [Bdellovibrionales bacterium RIFOXYB1_FULL_39_21]OFZ41408.1 MAG: hypothetical protein A2485_01400 [Bdellovibrionales bacterium RIFOXYC12_FULL_39_17]OFZ45363.1 MAG: hypothetical protein A2404_13415 [Bdellovibrionales bacterium RIFOXYC1_FULL_39_130]OFZ71947.1 MAG: hypothetical protein A2451_04210 [Bdellovibrionales bacterium RIFOXYC2_FULL_39_8]OFZ74559.1 MAG: hypothetical protein A2560_12520 [Bdellovibrionales bacterium RIFOXYD1_FULL_39_84]OFZ92568.1 MAG: